MGKYIKSSYKNIFLLLLLAILIPIQVNEYCSICLNKLDENYLIDVWGNKFHQYHDRDGHYCNSCSRLISEGITHGGYRTSDERYICNLCYPNLIYESTSIEVSRFNVIQELKKVGFGELPENTLIVLLDKINLLEKSRNAYHKNLKGFTEINNKNGIDRYTIYILNNLHKIEFEGVLAHEYLHIWQDIFNIKLNESKSEGLCNLASEIIYEHYNNQFSQILKIALEKDNTIYGIGYKKMKIKKNELGWNRFIEKIKSNYSY